MSAGLAGFSEYLATYLKPEQIAEVESAYVFSRIAHEGQFRRTHLSLREAQGFYAVHAARPFYGELCEFMSSGPCVLMVLEGENAILRNREIMGATNPAAAAEGTLRKLYASSIGENAVHGSDAPETAAVEISYFFRGVDLL